MCLIRRMVCGRGNLSKLGKHCYRDVSVSGSAESGNGANLDDGDNSGNGEDGDSMSDEGRKKGLV